MNEVILLWGGKSQSWHLVKVVVEHLPYGRLLLEAEGVLHPGVRLLHLGNLAGVGRVGLAGVLEHEVGVVVVLQEIINCALDALNLEKRN